MDATTTADRSTASRPAAATPVSVDLLVRHAWIVTMDGERRIYRDGAIAVLGDRIHAVGQDADIAAAVTPRETIDGSRFVLTPGFVNCHVHVTGEPITRGYVPDDTGWQANVFDWLIPTYQAQTPADERLSATFAAIEMLRTGTTTFLKAGTILDLDAVHDGLAATGIRGRFGPWVQDRAFAAHEDQAAMTTAAIARMEAAMARYPGAADGLLAAWPCLVGHVTATDELWRAATDLARDHDAGVTAHMSPDPADPEFYLASAGRRPVHHLAELGALGPHVSLTHAVHLDAAEVDLLAETGTNVTHCPTTAMKGGYGASSAGRFPEMVASRINIQLGTDGNNNGNSADMMRAMFAAAGLHRDAHRDTNLFSAARVLECATVNGRAAPSSRITSGRSSPA